MLTRNISSAVLPLFLLVQFGCSEDPGEVGKGLLTDRDTLHLETRVFTATSATNFLNRINGNSGRVLAGLYQDLEARTLVEFSGIPAFHPGVRIDSASFSLGIEYRFNDSTGEYGLTAHRMTRTWDAKSFTWDSVSGSFDDASAGSFLKAVGSADTTVTLRVDTALIRQWSQTGAGSLMLIPSLTTQLVLGFSNRTTAAADLRPLLTVSYRDSADTTVPFTARASRSIFVANAALPSQSEITFVQAGVRYGGLLRFDSLSVPPKVSVLKAWLEISTDQQASFINGFSRDSLIAFLLRKDAYPYDSLALGAVCSPVQNGTQKIYRAEVTNIVQQWITREPNHGFALHALADFTTLDRFALNGIGASDSLRPKLTVSYTVFP